MRRRSAIEPVIGHVKSEHKEWIIQDVAVWGATHQFSIHRTANEVVVAASDGLVFIRSFQIDPDFIQKE
jgi:hypothetical protein